MNFGLLKTAILDDTHRPDLTSHVARFVRQCEGMIRRDLRGYPITAEITSANQIEDGIYSLPARVSEVRTIIPQGRQGDSLQQVAPGQIRRLDATADVLQFAMLGDNENEELIEFRGVPGASDVFDILYYGTPVAFLNDSDLNDLLTNHETLYMAGSKFFLYLHTQDRELAQDELQIYRGVMDSLNEAEARRLGGANITPTYNFAGGSSY